MTQRRNVKARRIYDPALPEDGTRVLVDRIWPERPAPPLGGARR